MEISLDIFEEIALWVKANVKSHNCSDKIIINGNENEIVVTHPRKMEDENETTIGNVFENRVFRISIKDLKEREESEAISNFLKTINEKYT